MKRLFSALALAVTAALLWQSATPAQACDCGPPTDEEALREFIQRYDLVILGAVAESPSPQMQFDVERVYVGSRVSRVTLDQPSRPGKGDNSGLLELSRGDCSYTLLGEPGERYLLTLYRATDGATYRASSCGSRSFELVNRVPGVASYFSAIEAITGGGIDPRQVDRPGQDDVPTFPLAVAAVALPLAFVLAASFVFPANGSRA